MRLSHNDPRDVDYIAAVLTFALAGRDWDDPMVDLFRDDYRRVADAVLRAIEIGEIRK